MKIQKRIKQLLIIMSVAIPVAYAFFFFVAFVGWLPGVYHKTSEGIFLFLIQHLVGISILIGVILGYMVWHSFDKAARIKKKSQQ